MIPAISARKSTDQNFSDDKKSVTRQIEQTRPMPEQEVAHHRLLERLSR